MFRSKEHKFRCFRSQGGERRAEMHFGIVIAALFSVHQKRTGTILICGQSTRFRPVMEILANDLAAEFGRRNFVHPTLSLQFATALQFATTP